MERRTAIAIGLPDDLEQCVRLELDQLRYRLASSPVPSLETAEAEQLQGALSEGVDALLLGSALFLALGHGNNEDVIQSGVARAYLCIKAALRGMIRRRFGRIIAIAPPLLSGAPADLTLRLALSGLVKSVAREVGSRGITANVVAPGFLKAGGTHVSPYVAAGRPGTLDEVARVVRFLAADDSSYVNGQVLTVDGGLS